MEKTEYDNLIDSAIEQAAANMELENYTITEADKQELKGMLSENSNNKVLVITNNSKRNSNYGRME